MKKRRIFGLILISIILFSVAPNLIFASGDKEEFSLIAHKTNILECEDQEPESCEAGDALSDSDFIEPGQVFQVDIYYSPSSVGNTGFNYTINYDSDFFEVVEYGEDGNTFDDHSYATALYNDGVWPAKGTSNTNKKKTNWSVNPNYTENQIVVNAADSTTDTDNPFNTAGIVGSFWLKVKDSATAGAVPKLTWEKDEMAVDRTDGKKETIVTNDLSFTVYGAMNTDGSLSDLTLTGNNGTVYPTTPGFTAGTSERSFSVVVPNAVSSITIAATATDSSATVLPGGLGNKTLSVGDNTFNVTVQPQSSGASAQVYEITVYRLSNDATLKTLNLSGVTLDSNLTSGVYTYTATTPYAINATTVSATANHSKAKIASTLGSWDLTNTGSTLNTKTITVQAENCDSKYASVAGNQCTSQDYTLNVTRTPASTDNKLTDIKIDGTSISGFNSNTFTYTLPDQANNKTSLNVTATLSDSKATLTGTGSKSLNVGNNTITLTVTAENGSTQDYVINVKRLSNNGNLATLSVTSTPQGTLSPSFSPTFYNYYTYTYDSTVTSIDVAATLEDSKATITSGLGTYSSGDTGANVVVTAEDGSVKTYVIKFARNKSSDATLKSLGIDGYNLNETFNSSTTLYTATVPGTVSSINVTAEKNDPNATIVSGTGSHTLNYGTNTIQVRVKAENNSTKDYTITVTRSKKTISTLSDLTVDGNSVTGFNKDVLSYDYGTVPFDKTSVNIGYTKSDTDATVTGDGVVNLSTGDNTITVEVTAHDGTTKTQYTIHIYRTKSDNAFLSNLSVAGYPFTFNKNTNSYTIEVPYETTSVSVTATPEYSAATVVSGGPATLAVGDNNYTYAVTAENGSTTNLYTLKVTRKPSTNTSLTNLTVTNNGTNYLGAFNNNTDTYNITVNNEITSVDINAILADSINQTVSGTGTKTLNTGLNTFVVKVTAASGATKDYTLNITRSLNSNKNLATLEVVGHSINPTFSASVTSYTLTVESNIENVVINATSEVSTSSVTGTGTKSLVTGTNTFNVKVTAEDGTDRTYVIVVTKKASNDSSLKSLSITEALLNETFISSNTSYTASVGNGVNKIHVLAEANDEKAKSVTGTGEVNLHTGSNTINIVVTAEDNTQTTYTLVVDRAKSTNAYLSNLSLSNGFSLNKTFDKNDLEYSVNVPNSTSKLLISATKEDETATITGAGEVNLATGPNRIVVRVTAEDTSVYKEYVVNITRAYSSNNYLSSISSTDGLVTPTFNKDTKEYTLTVPYEVENANLTATTEDSAATVFISGNTGLAVGVTRASILVTAENGSVNTYYVDITRQPSSNNYLSNLEVLDSSNTNYITVFNKLTLTYNITVDNDISSVTINAQAEDSDTTIRGTGSKNLEVGSNSFTIESISASGVTRNYIVNVTRAQNSNTYLSTLSVDDQTLVPDFNKEVVSYSLNVDSDVEEITINATAEATTSTLTGTGTKQLTTGLNTFNIKVTAEDGTDKTYVIVVNKAASNNNYLASLLVSEEFTPEFNKETISYNATVGNEVTSITVQGVAEDADARVEGNGTHNLTVGNNSVVLMVYAEDNTFRAYTINVYREPSTNNYLSDLKIDGATITGFNKETLTYTWTVGNEVTSLGISATAEDSTATVTNVTNWNLNTGVNNTSVVVTAEDGTSRVYNLEVTRELSGNNNLILLNVLEGTLSPAFDKGTLDYTIEVPYEVQNLTLTTMMEDANATVEIEGNASFSIGNDNHVYITVIAENGSQKQYKIQVKRLQQANNSLSSLTVTSDKGTKYALTPNFDKNVLNYVVDINADDNILTIGGTKEASSASVVGFETITVNSYPYKHSVVVTSASGVARTYNITFNKIKSNNAKLKELTISNGTLSPAFNENTKNYSVTVPYDVDKIDISALGYEGSSIAGTGNNISLNQGNNTISIVVTAENGNTETYTINIEREKETEVTLSDINVIGGKLTPTFKSDVNNYIAFISDGATEVTLNPIASNLNSTIKISIDDGPYQEISSITVTDLTKDSRVLIKVENDGKDNIYSVTVLNQGSEEITSVNYGHTIEDGMIKTVVPDTSSEKIKQELDNDVEKLKVYYSDGKTEYNGDNVATGMIVKLFINEVVVDQKVIVVIGDTDGNGSINAIDALKVINHILEIDSLTGCYKIAAETTHDNTINAIDALKIINHIIGSERLR